MLGVDVQTLHAWETSGELVPDRKSKGGTRSYDVGKLMGLGNEDMPTVGYARVCSHDQKNDLVRQSELLEAFCAAKGWRNEIITDLGSGLTYRKKGLHQRLDLILHTRIRRLVLTHKDRLLRFGSDLIVALCEIQNIEIVIINTGEPPSFEEELAQDVIEIITVFSARLYGSRSHQSKRLLNELTEGKRTSSEVHTGRHHSDIDVARGCARHRDTRSADRDGRHAAARHPVPRPADRREADHRCCWPIK